MVKVVRFHEFGGPEVLKIENIDLPKPGTKEVLIKNNCIGLNYIDTYHRSGLYPLKLPSGIGLEAAGKVEEVGSNVKEFNIGINII